MNGQLAGELRVCGPRSCITCAKAKARCVHPHGNAKCERCARLEKECRMKEPALRRRKITKPTRAAQLEKIEHKIEHLVKALSTNQARRELELTQLTPPLSQDDPGTNRSIEILDTHCTSNGEDRPAGTTESTPVEDAGHCDHAKLRPAAIAPGRLSRRLPSDLEDCTELGISMVEAEIMLDRYKRLMAHHMPFVLIAPDVTAHQMYYTKPLLLHAIVTVGSFHDFGIQQEMLKQFMRNVADRVLINSEKHLSILQGILIVVAWYHIYLFNTKQINNLIHLARAMSIDLGIDKPPTMKCDSCKATGNKATHPSAPITSPMTRIPTLEEYRVFSGLYYLSSTLDTSFRKSETMPWTSCIESFLQELERARQFESDLHLVQIVRVQHLVEEIDAVQPRGETMPISACIKVFGTGLRTLKKCDQSSGVEMTIQLQMQYLIADVHVYELGLLDVMENDAKTLNLHLDNLYNLMTRIQGLIETFHRIPLEEFCTIPFSILGQYAHTIFVFSRLASLEVDGWDPANLYDEMRFIAILNESIALFTAAESSSPEGISVNNSGFSKWSQRLRCMRDVYEAKFVSPQSEGKEIEGRRMICDTPHTLDQTRTALTEEQEANVADLEQQQQQQQQQQQPDPLDDVLAGDFFSYVDETFWHNFPMAFELG